MKVTLLRRKYVLPKYIGKEDSDSVILFIHGLGGKSTTWSYFATMLKDNWVEEDSFDFKYDEYYSLHHWVHNIWGLRHLLMAGKIIFGPNIANLAIHLNKYLEDECISFDNVIIIAHSMGGLVARKYILDKFKVEKNAGKVRSLITYATPHDGSVIANYSRLVFYILTGSMLSRKNKQVKDLAKNSSFIKSLNSEWRDLRISDHIDFMRLVGINDAIVDINSSAYLHDDNSKWVSHDHMSIIRPFSIQDDAFSFTYKYLKSFRKGLEQKAEIIESTNEFIEEENEN